MSDAEDDATAWRFFEEQDRLRGGPADDLCGEGYTAHLAGFPGMGLEGHKGFAAASYAAFPDMRHTLRERWSTGITSPCGSSSPGPTPRASWVARQPEG